MDKTAERIARQRMHGLYLSRKCENIEQLSHELLGLHCWFHRNVAFSALIRGADLRGWKTALTKTWLYRGTLHGVVYEDLPLLLSLHPGKVGEAYTEIAEKVLLLMEDGVYSRAEMRKIFAFEYDERVIAEAFSPWGGVFYPLAKQGRVAFRNMTSRDFDLIAAEPTQSADETLPLLLRKFFAVYGPATLSDAAWFFGLWNARKRELLARNMDEYSRLEYNGETYYFVGESAQMGEIPELTLLSGFDPLIVSYVDRSILLPAQYKKAVILKSGICLPTIAVNGQIAGIWNIKKNEPVLEFFEDQPKRIQDAAYSKVSEILIRTMGQL
ncbi:MAG: winged helix DNA-binding domain-containing protein [Oscillospiraceae bacterium]|jgi:hypothetical protein|nr:winged helix DNA-binding domain-containing protein [Oscillospiraceae bacterium]